MPAVGFWIGPKRCAGVSLGNVTATLLAALAIGHFFGPGDDSERTVLAVECGVRHPGLALTIASANFGQEQALPILVPCVVTFIAMAMAYMIWRRKHARTEGSPIPGDR